MTAIETVKATAKDAKAKSKSKAEPAIEFAHQSSKLALHSPSQEDETTGSTQATEAKFVTDQDPVVVTADGGRLPAVPLEEAVKLNQLKDKLEDRDPRESLPEANGTREAKDGTIYGSTIHGVKSSDSVDDDDARSGQSTAPEALLSEAVPPSKTNPLFPPLPMYGPPTLLKSLQSWIFRLSSWIGSLCFLGVIVLGAIFTCIPRIFRLLFAYVRLQDPDARRPFYNEEVRRAKLRKEAETEWKRRKRTEPTRRLSSNSRDADEEESVHGESTSENTPTKERYIPTEGGPDPLVCDVGYYARVEGLDCETFLVQTEDGFIIELWHLYNPLTYTPKPESDRQPHEPDLFPQHVDDTIKARGEGYAQPYPRGQKKYPVLLLHGLLQSSGAYCCSGSNSLSFYLAKCGYDVWLGNNRCGFHPRHNMLKYSDPRMWAWNIRQMGVLDLPALVSRVLTETGFSKCALVAHSQGTTQTMVALAKEQRPELGKRLSCVCLLAPAAYAGPLIGKMYFKFMRVISPNLFRLIFGIHAFIPFMMTMHALLPARLYGFMGYRVFSFLFNWSDDRWERALRDRSFMFAPVYVSAESMRWWLGRECFARQKCILATKRETRMEDEEDREEDREERWENEKERVSQRQPSDASQHRYFDEGRSHPSERSDPVEEREDTPESSEANGKAKAPAENGSVTAPSRPNAKQQKQIESNRGRFAWYDQNAPPMAFWVAGSDDLVDGRRLLRRFERGREPYVNVVHKKIIEGYEHLDVIWAVDMVDTVGREVGEVVWKTAAQDAKGVCRTPMLDREET